MYDRLHIFSNRQRNINKSLVSFIVINRLQKLYMITCKFHCLVTRRHLYFVSKRWETDPQLNAHCALSKETPGNEAENCTRQSYTNALLFQPINGTQTRFPTLGTSHVIAFGIWLVHIVTCAFVWFNFRQSLTSHSFNLTFLTILLLFINC